MPHVLPMRSQLTRYWLKIERYIRNKVGFWKRRLVSTVDSWKRALIESQVRWMTSRLLHIIKCEKGQLAMDDRQFRELMSEFISNQWRMFWCYVSVAAVGVVILSIVFYATTRSDLQTIMRALDSANRQTAASNSVQILAPRTREDTIYDVLKSQGNVK